MTIGDVLAWCVEQGIEWHHPSWDDAPERTRWCAAWIDLANGWVVSIGCCDTHYCSWRNLSAFTLDIYGSSKTPEEWFSSPDAEIAIFRPDGSWYIPEGEDGEPGDTWVGGWWEAARIQNVIAYIAAQ